MENKIIYYDETDSTNTRMKYLAREDAEHGTVVVAKCQTEGRGRSGRTWNSPQGDNVYMSMLLRPDFVASQAPMLTLVMAYSVLKAIQKQGYEGLQIKWPNDLVMAGKKICGILTELHMWDTAVYYAIVGVGINVDTVDFPPELQEMATSLFLETGKKADTQKLIFDIISIFKHEYERFDNVRNLSYMKEEFNSMLVNCGKEVRVLEPGNEYSAYALGIDSCGHLLVRKEDGSVENVYAGEVSVRGFYGYV